LGGCLKQGNQSGVVPTQLIQLRGPANGHGVRASALVGLVIDSMTFPLARSLIL